MAFEHRPDGALVLRMHVPLAASLTVMALCFGFGAMFAYGLFVEDTNQVRYRGVDLGFSLDPLVWNALFLLGMAAMLVPGVFILLGLLRGSKPYVRVGAKRLEIRDRPMAADIVMRWDEIAETFRYHIHHGRAIRVRSGNGRKIDLSAHVFREADDFEELCREIELRAQLATSRSGDEASGARLARR